MLKNKKHNKLREKGITLIALVITIIVLLILAGVALSALTGDSGILSNAEKAKEKTEIANEKEIIKLALSEARIEVRTGRVTTEDMEKVMDKNIAEVINDGDNIAIKFEKSGRYYNVDEEGNIEQFTPYVDTTPGELATNSNGEYMIESVEDLVVLSASANGGYSDEKLNIGALTGYVQKNIVLMRDLDFKSPLSYVDSTTYDYNGYLGVEEENVTLMEALTNIEKHKGFIPIGKDTVITVIVFDGGNHQIRNLYENSENYAGLFGFLAGKSEIKNLTITGEINSTTYAGGIIGGSRDNATIITNCKNYAKVSGATVGGICGNFTSSLTIESCINYGEVCTTSGKAGGICGELGASPIIKSCINYGEVSAISGNAGGIAAYQGGVSLRFDYCMNAGKVSGIKAGGILGSKLSTSVTFNSCLNSIEAEVVGGASSEGRAGGIIGGKINPVNFYIYNCANLGSVSGYYSGGIYGSWGDTNILVNCFGGGNITGTYAGGIAGESYGEPAYNCYYLKNNNVKYSVGEQASNTIDAEGITEITQAVINSLNSYIDNPLDEGIDTTGWKKWRLDENRNPTFVE